MYGIIPPRSECIEASPLATEPLATHFFDAEWTEVGPPVSGPLAVHSSDIGQVGVDPPTADPLDTYTILQAGIIATLLTYTRLI